MYKLKESELSHIVELFGLGVFIVAIAVVNFNVASNDGGMVTFVVHYLSPVAGSLLILNGLLTVLLHRRWAEGSFWIGVGYLFAAMGNTAIFGPEDTPLFILSGLIFLWVSYFVYVHPWVGRSPFSA